MSPVVKNKRAQNIILLLALCFLAGAVLLKLYIAKNNPFDEIISMLSSHGYTVREDELYIEGEYRDTTIQSVLQNVDLTQAVQASEQKGFPSRIGQTGNVVLLLAATNEEDIITLYYLNGQPELCFVQKADSHDVKPLGKERP